MDADAVVYLNGSFLPRRAAALDIEDRAALFADGVYEVLRYYAGRPFAMVEHLARLRTSLSAVGIPEPPEIGLFDQVSDELVSRNALRDAKVYWQVSRGAAARDHAWPQAARPTVLMIAYRQPPVAREADGPAPRTWRAILAPDERWAHCWIKSLMLLPNVLAKHRAAEAGADEAILHRGERVTEGTTTSLFIVRRGELWTHPADQWILGGITRATLIALAKAAGLPVQERPFSVAELLEADEVFLCGTTTHLAAVTEIDGRAIGGGQVGPCAARLHRLLMGHIAEACGLPSGSAVAGRR